MAVEGDKLQSLISKMVEIETAEQPAEEVVVEMTPEEKARKDLVQAVGHAKNILVNYINSTSLTFSTKKNLQQIE